jgi:hypothetical protein
MDVDNVQNDPGLAIAIALSLSMGSDTQQDQEAEATKREVAAVQLLVAEETDRYMRRYGRTCILDLGQYFGVLSDGAKTSFTNKCAVLCVWWALMIQRELGYCTVSAPYKVDSFPSVNDLYLAVCDSMKKLSVKAAKKCKRCLGTNSKCQVCCKTYSQNESFPGEMMGIIARLVGMPIYVWDVENERTLKYIPVGPDGTRYEGVNDIETKDHRRKIVLARLPGHYVVLPSMFSLRRSTATSTDYNYNHVAWAIERIGLVHEDSNGCVVTVGPPQPIHNLGSDGVSYTPFTDGSIEPRLTTPTDDASYREALRLNLELNGSL